MPARIQLARPDLPELDDYVQRLGAVWESAHLSNFGPATRELEAIARSYTGLEQVHAVVNADIGLTLAIAALGLPRGARAVVPSFTFPSTLHAVLWNGLTPVFADVDPATWCLTADAVPAVADLIVGAHVFMGICDVAGLHALAAERGIPLVFDAAQAYASRLGDRHVGCFGDASVFSLGATKLVTSGEGGLAAFRDPGPAERFVRLRRHGMTPGYEVLEPGLNGKLSELHAALGCLTLPRAEERAVALLELAGRYRERLHGRVGLQALPDDLRPTPTHVVADVGKRRDALAAALDAQGIETRRYFRPLHAMDAFAAVERPALPVSERLGRSLLTLPLHAGMDAGDVDRVCDALLAAV
jgi:dTDP-4-amino-4,6-dideoxygalactose transaminase